MTFRHKLYSFGFTNYTFIWVSKAAEEVAYCIVESKMNTMQQNMSHMYVCGITAEARCVE